MKKSLGAKTIAFPTPTWVVAAYDKDGRPNVMTAAWGGVCCSKPPCLTVSLQKPRYTFDCIMERGAYTVNVPSEAQVEIADYIGIVSGRDRDKFADCGLTAVKSDLVDAPYVAEFPMVMECRVVETLELGVHTQFVGEIMDVKMDEAALTEDGRPDIERVRPIVFGAGARTYHGIGDYLGPAFSLGKKIKEAL